jgi:hypothetical protein|tara:strand:- start:291 stop:611 length:321 start_codon:yes stop_codon:yes gene_type:complete
MIKSYKDFLVDENLSLGDIGGMGAVVLPNQGEIGSGDVPAGRKKKKKKTKEVNEGKFDKAIEGVEISIDGLSTIDAALTVSTALISSYGGETAFEILGYLNKYIKK